jgi:hypothetical protein
VALENLSKEVLTEIRKLSRNFSKLIDLFNSMRIYPRPLHAKITFSLFDENGLFPQLSIGPRLFVDGGSGSTNIIRNIANDIRALELFETLVDRKPGRSDSKIEQMTNLKLSKRSFSWNTKYHATSLEMALSQIVGAKLTNSGFLQSALDDPASVAPEIHMRLVDSVSDEISELRKFRSSWASK